MYGVNSPFSTLGAAVSALGRHCGRAAPRPGEGGLEVWMDRHSWPAPTLSATDPAARRGETEAIPVAGRALAAGRDPTGVGGVKG